MLIATLSCKNEDKRVRGGGTDSALPISAVFGMNISPAIFLVYYKRTLFDGKFSIDAPKSKVYLFIDELKFAKELARFCQLFVLRYPLHNQPVVPL